MVDVSPALPDGTYSARAEQDDLAGNTGYSSVHAFTVDTAASAVTVTAPASSTNSVKPTLAGQAGAAPGDSASVHVDLYSGGTASGAPIEALVATRSGSSWSIAASSTLADGTYIVGRASRTPSGTSVSARGARSRSTRRRPRRR